jgi:hypothetical protein
MDGGTALGWQMNLSRHGGNGSIANSGHDTATETRRYQPKDEQAFAGARSSYSNATKTYEI